MELASPLSMLTSAGVLWPSHSAAVDLWLVSLRHISALLSFSLEVARSHLFLCSSQHFVHHGSSVSVDCVEFLASRGDLGGKEAVGLGQEKTKGVGKSL